MSEKYEIWPYITFRLSITVEITIKYRPRFIFFLYDRSVKCSTKSSITPRT